MCIFIIFNNNLLDGKGDTVLSFTPPMTSEAVACNN